jgi:tetratricopeptide (TPR) repeat protein
VNARTRRAPDPQHAEAYRLSLEGWRRFEKKDLDDAQALLERSITLNPADPVAHYRLARVLVASKNERALEEFETAIRSARACPPPILGAAYVEAARLHERTGRRDQAISLYRVAASLFGASADTRAVAARALTRLGVDEARTPRK